MFIQLQGGGGCSIPGGSARLRREDDRQDFQAVSGLASVHCHAAGQSSKGRETR